MNTDILLPMRIKLYPNEAKLLRAFLLKIHLQVYELQGQSYNGYIILAEWFQKYYMARSLSIEHGSNKIAKRIDVPVSIARLLLTEMTSTVIPIELNIILGQLHRQLTNRNFLPV